MKEIGRKVSRNKCPGFLRKGDQIASDRDKWKTITLKRLKSD